MLAGPAAGAFGQLGVPLTVARHLGIDPPAIAAIGDCMPRRGHWRPVPAARRRSASPFGSVSGCVAPGCLSTSSE
eukprot:2729545-Prymnesium_polylepis.1